VNPPKIAFKILYYEGRHWYQKKYDVKISAFGFMIPDTNWVASFWTAEGARKFVEREAAKRDFKVIDQAVMEHEQG
jgi:hypothetical protein